MIQRNPRLKFDLTFPSAQPQVYQRLGEKQATDIIVQVCNDGKPFSLTGVRFGFELRNDKAKIIIDTNQAHFSVIDNAKGIFRYRVTDEGFGYIGNSYLAYFTLTISDVRITTERFRFHNDEDVQVGADGLQEHYVSVIDDLVASNTEAIAKAQEIKAMIEANQVVKKSGDTMTGDLSMQANIKLQGDTERNLAFRTLTDNREFAKMYANPDKNRVGLYSTKNIKSVWEYDGSADSFNVNTNTNLLKKTGDTMTGNIGLDRSSGERSISWYKSGNETTKIADNDTRTMLYSTEGNEIVWTYEKASKTFEVRATNTNLVKKDKDGTALLVLTADGENPSTSIPQKATRRGNTVTVNGSFQNKVGSASTIVTILPANMRPATAQDFIATSTDGTHVQVHINPNGNIALTVKGKNVLLNATYVVD